MTQPVLVAEQLTKIFYPAKEHLLYPKRRPFKAVNDISFELRGGEILGLLGPNGAGKTTTIQMLLGTLLPTRGTISYFGKNFFSHRSEILEQVSHASAYTKLPGALTIEENLDIFARLYGVHEAERKKRINQLLEDFAIEELRYRTANTLSAGQTTRLMLVKAFLPYPKIVLLDEPTASLDPDMAKETRSFILKQQQEHGVSIILTSHNMQEVTEVCNRVLVLRHGSIIEEDTPLQLARSVALSQLYLTVEELNAEALAYLEKQPWKYVLERHALTVELDESRISDFLIDLAQLQIRYSRIEIRKPSLEDYFLHIAKKETQ